MLAIGHIKTVTIEVREHPLMRIEAVAVGEFHAVMEEAELRTESSGAAHRGIDVQPQIVFSAKSADFAYGVDCIGRGCADGCANEAGNKAGFFVGIDLASERVDTEREILIHFNGAKVIRTKPRDFHCFLY